nr:retrotransposon protein, putative, Ty1-copia subclass [Tanacetum cinerariifolium]
MTQAEEGDSAFEDHGIIAHRTPPYTPQHNGVSDGRNRTLLDMVRSMMSQTTLPKSFWEYALETAVRILNMVPTKKVEKTPYEVWHGKVPKLSYLKVRAQIYKVYLRRIPKGNDVIFFLLPTREQKADSSDSEADSSPHCNSSSSSPNSYNSTSSRNKFSRIKTRVEATTDMDIDNHEPGLDFYLTTSPSHSHHSSPNTAQQDPSTHTSAILQLSWH